MVIEVLLGAEPDRATASWASLTLGKAFTNVTICFLVSHFLLAPRTLELHLLESLLLELIQHRTGKG